MKRWRPIAFSAIIIVSVVLMIGRGELRTPNMTRQYTNNASGSQNSLPAQSPDPLTIASIRSKHYQASPIQTVKSLGDEGGYTDKVVSFTSDGLKEYALQATPDTAKPAGGYPVVILLHGYVPPDQYRTTDSSYQDFIAAWARAGIVVIKPDFRGNGSSQGTAVSGHYSPDYTYDTLNLIASLKQYAQVNAHRLGIAGHSMGGHIALNVAVASHDIKATVILNGVVGSMYDIFYEWPNSPAPYDQPTQVVQAELQNLVAKHGTPKTNPGFYNQVSAINFVDFIQGPVQISQDVDDSTVPKAFADSLDAALTNAGKSVTYFTYPGNDHQLEIPETRNLVLQRTTSFFQSNL